MKILLDTNIIIHRESTRVLNQDIGILFNWFDKLRYVKYIHPVTIEEINKLKKDDLRDLMNVKINSYNVIQVIAPIHPNVATISMKYDVSENDKNDTVLLNELYINRVDFLITEDRKIARKAVELGIFERVFTIDAFLEKVTAENPELTDYKVLAVKREFFGSIDVKDSFFDSFRDDYPGFENWFNRKSDEKAYVCREGNKITAFLYLKVEDKDEPYYDLEPSFRPKKRLKIGTFKVTLNGYKLGERFLKIIFDNAVRHSVDEIYVTIFEKTVEQQRLIHLLEDFGFEKYGYKNNDFGKENVYVRNIIRQVNRTSPRLSFPFISRSSQAYIVSIYPEYHTELLPDSILKTESPSQYVDNEPFRNAISKVYICRSYFKNLKVGDIIIFYRTGGQYKGVATTIGVVENVTINIKDVNHFILLCRKRSVFSDQKLIEQWNFRTNNRPFIVNFLYSYSFPKRPNLKTLVDIGVIPDIMSAPRGFEPVRRDAFERLLVEAEVDARFIID